VRQIDPESIGHDGSSVDRPPREELERALQWQQAIFEGSRDAIFISDSASRFIAVNHAACELTGYSREELLRMSIPDLHDEVDLDAYRLYHDSIMSGQETLSEAMILRRDGAKVETEFNNRRIVIDGISYMHTTARDISPRRRAEEALAERDELLGRIFNGSNDAIFIAGLDGRILDANLTASATLGYGVEELRRMSVADVILPQAAAKMFDRIAEVRREGRAIFETTHCSPDGKTLTMEVGSSLIDFRGEPAILGICRDVSARKRAEELLRESAEKYRSLVENTSEGICISQDGWLKFVNPSLVKLSGYGEQELKARPLIEFIHPDDRGYVTAFTEQKLQSVSEPPSYEFRVVTKDGGVRWARNSAVLIDWEGHPATLNFLTDVTGRKSAAEALRESEARYRALFEESPVVKLIYDPHTLAIVEVNRAAVERYGYTRDEFLAMTIPDLHLAEDAEDVRRLAGTDMPTPFHVGPGRHRRKDGTLIDVDIDRQEIVLAGRQVRVAVVHDTTEVTSLLRALEQEKERLRILVEAAPFAIMQVAPDGRILFVNPKFTSLFGYELEDVPHLSRWRELAFPDPDYHRHVVSAWESSAQSVRAGQTLTHTFQVRCKDGSGRIIVFNCVLTSAGERVISGEDVTDAHRLEDQLRHAQKMEAVGRLAGGIAHDFNNLLQAMLSQVQLGRVSWRPREAELTELETQIRRGAGLARQLLLFSRHEEARRVRLDLGAVVRDAADLLRRLVRENIDLVVETSQDALLVEADPGQVDQVLMNLVVNAADAMPAGGRITIRTGRGDGMVWLAVRDAGPGIPDRIRDKIFEPYFTTKSIGHGTGLGLSVVDGIVSRHGGRIEVDSREREGTTFVVFLPECQPDGTPLAAVSHDSGNLPTGDGKSVLIVEDESTARAGLAEILASLGYRVTAVCCATDARRLPLAPAFDVLLTDVMLPDVDGATLASDLIKRWPPLKVILMSGYSKDEALRHAAELGSVRFLQKPFGMATLAHAIAEALSRGSTE
jgi:two-component system cell cycle sensor histidine kinase/response regulator CckA